jgi:hypothetical protein
MIELEDGGLFFGDGGNTSSSKPLSAKEIKDIKDFVARQNAKPKTQDQLAKELANKKPYATLEPKFYNASNTDTTGPVGHENWYAKKREREDQAILDRRRQVKEQAAKDIKEDTWRNTLATTENLTNAFRLFPDDPNSFIDDYLNPLQMVGTMAGNLGRHFASDAGPIDPLALGLDIAVPLSVGALGGLGTTTTGEFANNVFNPLVGAGEFLTTKTPLKNAYKLNPWAFKPNPERFYRQVGEPGYLNAIQEGKVLAKGQKEFLEKNPGFNYWDEYNQFMDYANKSGGLNLRKPATAPFFQKGELFFPISNKTGFGRGKTASSDVKYLFEGQLPEEAIIPRYRDQALSKEAFYGPNGGTGVLNPQYSDLSNFKTYQKDWLQGYKEIPTTQPNYNMGAGVTGRTGSTNRSTPTDGLQFMKDWYSHPDFLKRYGRTAMYDPASAQSHMVDLLNRYKNKNYLDLLKDKGLNTYLENINSSKGLSYNVPEGIYVNRPAHWFDKAGLESTRVHELSHLTNKGGKLYGVKEEDALLKPFGYDYNSRYQKEFGSNLSKKELKSKNYYLDPTEIHARMAEARNRYNLSPADEFTEKMYDDMIQNANNWEGMGKYIKDKPAMIKLMNNFWTASPYAIPVGLGVSLYNSPNKTEYAKGGMTFLENGGMFFNFEK